MSMTAIADVRTIAAALVEARRQRVALPMFPGGVPDTLDAAYAIQRCAIEEWGDTIAGWKVGRLDASSSERYGVDRFIGPVFERDVVRAGDGETSLFPIVPGGSGAFEAELVAIADVDQPVRIARWTIEGATELVGSIHIGIEMAGSSVANIAALPSTGSIAAFGNNSGQIIGPIISLAPGPLLDDVIVSSSVHGRVVRTAAASVLPGGPMTAFKFALDQLQALGMPLRKGQFVSTGAVTGMHQVTEGQCWEAVFQRHGRLVCRIVV
ncbi:2-keto-4-pentenoate hydratase [Novosphingobium sp.]|uniref:2-keto-4-pentenoate hydratase n=1 Tax=Novosphingobium sp. TaxID=1874826 RepID=UPI002FE31634